MTQPTKETHVYKGMWRPPFQAVKDTANKENYVHCGCGAQFYIYPFGGSKIGDAFVDHWLAGHFDEPIYEEKYPEPRLLGPIVETLPRRTHKSKDYSDTRFSRREWWYT